MTRSIQVGTVIAGTLRTDDLLESFSQELDSIRGNSKAHYRLVFDAQNRNYLDDGRDEREEEVSEIVNELQDALNEYAPDGMYFGTLEGDGADFGWWAIDSEKDGALFPDSDAKFTTLQKAINWMVDLHKIQTLTDAHTQIKEEG